MKKRKEREQQFASVLFEISIIKKKIFSGQKKEKIFFFDDIVESTDKQKESFFFPLNVELYWKFQKKWKLDLLTVQSYERIGQDVVTGVQAIGSLMDVFIIPVESVL